MALIFNEIHFHLSKIIHEKYIIQKIQDLVGIVNKKKYIYNFFKYYIENYENVIFVYFQEIWVYVEKRDDEFILYLITRIQIRKEDDIKIKFLNIKITKENDVYTISIKNFNKNQILFLLYLIIEKYDYFIPQPALFNKIYLDHYKYKYNFDEMKTEKIFIDVDVLDLWDKLDNNNYKNEKLQYIEI